MLSRHDFFYADRFIETDSGITVSLYLASKLQAYDPEDDEGDMGGRR